MPLAMPLRSMPADDGHVRHVQHRSSLWQWPPEHCSSTSPARDTADLVFPKFVSTTRSCVSLLGISTFALGRSFWLWRQLRINFIPTSMAPSRPADQYPSYPVHYVSSTRRLAWRRACVIETLSSFMKLLHASFRVAITSHGEQEAVFCQEIQK